MDKAETHFCESIASRANESEQSKTDQRRMKWFAAARYTYVTCLPTPIQTNTGPLLIVRINFPFCILVNLSLCVLVAQLFGHQRAPQVALLVLRPMLSDPKL